MSFIFEFKNIGKRFGSEVALDDFTLTGERGTVTALLGENGAGKTTSLRILLGLIKADAGSSQVYGLDSSLHGDDIRHRVGYVPDQPSLYEWMTVDEIGWYCGGFYQKEFVTKYRELAQGFELPFKKRISTMSKGMKAKVSLASCRFHNSSRENDPRSCSRRPTFAETAPVSNSTATPTPRDLRTLSIAEVKIPLRIQDTTEATPTSLRGFVYDWKHQRS